MLELDKNFIGRDNCRFRENSIKGIGIAITRIFRVRESDPEESISEDRPSLSSFGQTVNIMIDLAGAIGRKLRAHFVRHTLPDITHLGGKRPYCPRAQHRLARGKLESLENWIFSILEGTALETLLNQSFNIGSCDFDSHYPRFSLRRLERSRSVSNLWFILARQALLPSIAAKKSWRVHASLRTAVVGYHKGVTYIKEI